MKILVTGGAGFIGSHLVDALLKDSHMVVAMDNLASGKEENLNPEAVLIRKDVQADISSDLEGVEALFHLAADPDVRSSAHAPEKSFDLNVKATFSLLESCRKADIPQVVFASTSTVYGETEVIPTPESHPCNPISNYGASKLTCEAYLSSYASTYGMQATVLRLANIFGERSTHGVMYDFFHKLKRDPMKLEILGDGKQDKSYLHVSDCVSAALTAWKEQKATYDVFNVGSREKRTVAEIASLMCDTLGLSPDLEYTGTARGWAGDVKLMLLDTSKLEALGWRQEVPFEDGLRRYISWLQR